MSKIISEVYFVPHGQKKSGKNIRDFVVGKGKPIPSPIVKSGDIFEFTHSNIKDDFGKEYDPYPGTQKDIIIVVDNNGNPMDLPSFPERNINSRNNQDRIIAIKIP